MKIGLAIAMRREQVGLTQEELAKAVGVSKASVCRWESGDISNMRRDRIQKLANALNISPLELLNEETEGFVHEKTPLEPLALKASKSEWIYILERMSEENLIKLRDYALLLLMSQDQDDQGDQGSAK